jgi:hypothetical protein
VKLLRNLIESLLGRLQADIDWEGNYTQHKPEELYTQWALSRAKM